MSATADDIWKHCDKGRNCSCMSSFATMFSKLSYLKMFISFSRVNIQDFSKGCLLQDCCKRERVKIGTKCNTCNTSQSWTIPLFPSVYFTIGSVMVQGLIEFRLIKFNIKCIPKWTEGIALFSVTVVLFSTVSSCLIT